MATVGDRRMPESAFTMRDPDVESQLIRRLSTDSGVTVTNITISE